jgi:hypothetical protein
MSKTEFKNGNFFVTANRSDVVNMIEHYRRTDMDGELSRWEKHLTDIDYYLKRNPNKSFDSLDKTGKDVTLANDGETYSGMGTIHIIATTVDIDNATKINDETPTQNKTT